METNERKEYMVTTEGDTMVTEEGLYYSSWIRVAKTDNTAIIWKIDEPLDLNAVNFENVKTLDDFYSAINNIVALGNYQNDFLNGVFEIESVDEIEWVEVSVDLEEYPAPDDNEIITETFETGIVCYDFINKKFFENEPDIAEMIDELTEYAECAGFKDYYNREIKDKTEEEIRKLYSEVFGK